MFSIVFLLVSPNEFNLSIIYNEKPNKILGVLTQDDIWIKDSIKTFLKLNNCLKKNHHNECLSWKNISLDLSLQP